MAKEAGRAVAKGLRYALLNPFPPSYQGPDVDADLQTYFKRLSDAISETHRRILEEAYRQIILENGDETELDKIRKRLRVYTWASKSDRLSACPGLGYKLYYHREELKSPELWHWLSTDEGEKLILQYAESPELAAIEFRFYPILECLEYEENCLPTDEDMKKRADLDYNRTPLWVVTDDISPEENKTLIEKAKRKPS
jgi:hypothetical protein